MEELINTLRESILTQATETFGLIIEYALILFAILTISFIFQSFFLFLFQKFHLTQKYAKTSSNRWIQCAFLFSSMYLVGSTLIFLKNSMVNDSILPVANIRLLALFEYYVSLEAPFWNNIILVLAPLSFLLSAASLRFIYLVETKNDNFLKFINWLFSVKDSLTKKSQSNSLSPITIIIIITIATAVAPGIGTFLAFLFILFLDSRVTKAKET